MNLTLDYPPVWLIAFMVLAWVFSHFHAPLGDSALWAGRALIGTGIGLALWAALAFRRARTTIVPHQPPSALVDSGPFQFSRNPIYVADLTVLAGWCFSVGSPLALALLIPFAWILHSRFILPEEARLTEHLGTPYTDYRTKVRRWI
ncbi:MAG: isoprenylcysteine carboxylmethyltransferase family protein [Pseudomonadota bacterium]